MILRFANFELDRGAYELRRKGRVVHLERIPLDLLFLLAERRGQMVPRDEIVERVWGKGVFLDSDASINAAIRKIRRALGDDADAPRFVVTVPGKGYRFIASACKDSLPTSAQPRAQPEEPRPTAAIATKSNDLQIRLADASAPKNVEGERKTVTALLADFKGSMGPNEDLDPEELRATVDPALKLMIDVVHHYDGYVIRSTDDGIFALFGAPVAHEDHPQRALSAALRMQAEVKSYAQKLRAEKGLNMQVRVGANTGEVVMRQILTGEGRTEYGPIGHSISVAAGVQMMAAPGSIAITESVRKRVEGFFTLKSLGPARVNGVSEPLEIYEVTGPGPLSTRFQRAAIRGYTKFVGRQREIDTLKRAAELAQAGRGQIVATVAEPGVGKSRLLFEFKDTTQSGWLVLEALSVSHGKRTAYLPLINLLHCYFRIAPEDDTRTRREKVAGKIAMLDGSLAQETLLYLFALLGIVEGEDPFVQMDPQVRRRRTQDAVKRVLLRESLNQPMIVVFEDLHWIDDATQGLLDLIADSIGTAKILLLVSYRPEYSHQWNSKTYYTQLRLDPLSGESAEEMLSALLGDGPDLLPLRRFIIDKTEGTPFFMEEIVQTLFEDGVLQRNGTVKLVKAMNAVKVPTTLQDVLVARIDRLPAQEKESLKTLAVLGREFPLSLVRLVTLKPDDQLEYELSRLQAGEFIYEQVASGDVEYVFKHALTQEVAYNSLLIERRRFLHERAGQALESLFSEQLDDHLAELAHHYSRSDNVAKAVEYLGRAGQQAARRSAYADAINSLTLAIDLLQHLPNGPERIRQELVLQLCVGPALMAVKGYGAAETARSYLRARDLCERLGDTPELFPALYGLISVDVVRGDLRRAYTTAEKLLQLPYRADDTALLMNARFAMGWTSYWMGEFLEAREYLESAISLYDADPHQPVAFRYGVHLGVYCRSFTARTLWHLGYPDQALKMTNQALAFAQDLFHPFSLAEAQWVGGLLHQCRREARATQETAEGLIEFFADQNFTEWLPWGTMMRGWAVAKQGRHEEGIALLQEGLAALRATGAELMRSNFLAWLAEASMGAGRIDDGLDAIRDALAEVDQREERLAAAEIYRLEAELLLRKSHLNAPKAQKCFERAIQTARKQHAKSWELRATIGLARLLRDTHRRDEARKMLADIYNWFTEGFDTADLKDAKALLDELGA